MKNFLSAFFVLNVFAAFSQNPSAVDFLKSSTRFDFRELSREVVSGPTDERPGIRPVIERSGDTSGWASGNELVLSGDFPADHSGKLIGRFIRTIPVTNIEYREMVAYIRDSIARETIYRSIFEDEVADGFLRIPRKEKFDRAGLEYTDIRRQKNRNLYALNFDEEFSFSDYSFVPLLAGMYLPQNERIYHVREFDDRKLVYRYFPLSASGRPELTDVPMLSRKYDWALESSFPQDEAYMLAQGYEFFDSFENRPLISLNGRQANAFCDWKQRELQAEADRKGLNIQLILTLPAPEELTYVDSQSATLLILSENHTDNWKITNSEYKLFVDYVTDSVLKEFYYGGIAYDEKAMRLLKYKNSFFDEAALEYVEFDPSDREFNRQYFPFRSVPLTESQRELTVKLKDYSSFGGYYFTYFWKDLKGLAAATTVTNLSRFIHREIVNVEADLIGSKLDAAKISYEQALAYYHWKFNCNLAKSAEKWTRFVLPSKEQFEKSQQGTVSQINTHLVSVPGQAFRYVVHVYEK